MELDFGVFFTCYKEKEAVSFAIKTLLQIYPDCPVYVVSDGGSDFSDLKELFPSVHTELEEDTRSFIPKLAASSYRNLENQQLIKSSIIQFLDRTSRAVKHCKKPWLLIMEPDVIVRGTLHAPEGAYLLGSRVNEGLSSDLREIVKSVKGSIDVNHWGATPALFDVDAFEKSKDVLLNTKGLLDALCLSDERLANYDVLFSVMFALAGYTETYNPELIECLREPYWRFSNKPLVHQFRELYPKKSAGYDGRHADEV